MRPKTEEDGNLFLEMEAEREKIPNALREDYFPVFVVRLLQERLCTDVNTDGNDRNGGGGESYRKADFSFKPFESKKGDTWTDDSLLEDNADFEGTFLIPNHSLNSVGRILKLAKEGVECSLLDKQKLLFQFTSEFEHPCLELLYFMDLNYELIPLNYYLIRLQALPQKSYFQNQFLAFCFSPETFSTQNQERSNKILSKFLQTFLLTYYCNPCSKPNLIGAKTLCGEILVEITNKLVCDEVTKPPHPNHKIVLAMLKDVNVPGSVRVKFFKERIKDILMLSAKTRRPELEILQFQEQFADPKKLIVAEFFTATVSQMTSVLSAEEVIQIVSSTISTDNFNWETLLYVISVWIQEKQRKATTILSDLIKSRIREGLSQRDEKSVISGFILARHCTLVAPEIFCRYVKWYSNMFESESYSPANDLEKFTYLASLMTRWIPIEPNCFIQTHTSHRPFVPTGCRDIWSDYLTLAKIRISEYKEVEEAMEFEPNPNNPIQYEVELAVKAFQTHKKIPQTIYQMWNFQRKRYIQDFVPALLQKPTGVSLSDARLRLVEVLKRDGKIPDELYSKYKQNRRAS